MDLSGLEQMMPDIAQWFNVDPATVVFWLGVICMACNVAGRLIPDDATGALGVARVVCKFIGAHVQNRVTTGVKTSDVIRDIAQSQLEAELRRRMGTDVIPESEPLELPVNPQVLTPFEKFKTIVESKPEDDSDAR